MTVAANLAWLDGTLLAVLVVSVLVGLWRGLVFELMSLVGWLVAYVLAQAFSARVGEWVPVGAPDSALRHGAAFAATFIGALIAWGLLARLLRMVIRATPLTLVDRLLGAGFGFLRGMVLLMAVATVVSMTPAARSEAWQTSRGAAWLHASLQALKPLLPDSVARHLPA